MTEEGPEGNGVWLMRLLKLNAEAIASNQSAVEFSLFTVARGFGDMDR